MSKPKIICLIFIAWVLTIAVNFLIVTYAPAPWGISDTFNKVASKMALALMVLNMIYSIVHFKDLKAGSKIIAILPGLIGIIMVAIKFACR